MEIEKITKLNDNNFFKFMNSLTTEQLILLVPKRLQNRYFNIKHYNDMNQLIKAKKEKLQKEEEKQNVKKMLDKYFKREKIFSKKINKQLNTYKKRLQKSYDDLLDLLDIEEAKEEDEEKFYIYQINIFQNSHKLNSEFFDKRYGVKMVPNVIVGEEYKYSIENENEEEDLIQWSKK